MINIREAIWVGRTRLIAIRSQVTSQNSKKDSIFFHFAPPTQLSLLSLARPTSLLPSLLLLLLLSFFLYRFFEHSETTFWTSLNDKILRADT